VNTLKRFGIRSSVGVFLGLCGVVFVPAWWSKADRFSAWATGVQAVGVIFALFLAGVSLQRDSHDRRVDRVMDLHRELVSGELSGPRFRLSRHLRELGSNGLVRSVSIWQLGTEGNLKYTDPEGGVTASRDLSLLLRYFERVNAAREAGTLDEDLLVRLLGRHAGWWSEAILDAPDGPPVGPALSELRNLAIWCNTRAVKLKIQDWGLTRAANFGPKA
jgi:hypothetical protein